METEGPPVPDMSDLHDHPDAAIRADEGLRAALVDSIQERPSRRLDLEAGAVPPTRVAKAPAQRADDDETVGHRSQLLARRRIGPIILGARRVGLFPLLFPTPAAHAEHQRDGE
jgi:hypothetical protein